jgi:hypothetical protein
MEKDEYKTGSKYSTRELMELAVQEMYDSIPDPDRSDDKPNPKVGAVIKSGHMSYVIDIFCFKYISGHLSGQAVVGSE